MNQKPTDIAENPVWESGRFSMTAGRHALLAMEETAGKLWWVAALPVAILAALGVAFDWRYGILAAMTVFIIMPLLVLMGWLKAMTSPGALRCVYDMEATVNSAGDLHLKFFHKSPSEPKESDKRGVPSEGDEEKEPGENNHQEVATTPTTESHPKDGALADISPTVLPLENLREIRFWRGCIVMDYPQFRLIIPLDDRRRQSIRTLLELTDMWDSHNYL